MLVLVEREVVNFSQHFVLKDFKTSKIVVWKVYISFTESHRLLNSSLYLVFYVSLTHSLHIPTLLNHFRVSFRHCDTIPLAIQ